MLELLYAQIRFAQASAALVGAAKEGKAALAAIRPHYTTIMQTEVG